MKLLRLAVVSALVLQTACAVSLKPPTSAPTARKVEATYGSSIMKLDEFSVVGAAEQNLKVGLSINGLGGVSDSTSSTRFTVLRANQPFVRVSCTAGSEKAVMRLGSMKLNHPPYFVKCEGDGGFTLKVSGNPEKPLAGVVTWRGEEFRVKTVFDTAEQGQSAHLGFVVEARDGWVSTADIQGTTWVAQPVREEAREAMVLANFAWASRRNVITAEASGFVINKI
ncbi:MAG: hypothetical protein SFW67_30855 [Myxococcaceae bacterium]|nr:hypothetical protein [Myxococcaceae bacterium]